MIFPFDLPNQFPNGQWKATNQVGKILMGGGQGINTYKGAQWLSGRVLDSRPKGRGFEPHRRHCVVVLEQDTFILA